MVLVVAGLAVSAPPACLCMPDDHFGLLLHPMFPHAHGAIHEAWDTEPVSTDSWPSAAVESAPGISAQAAESGVREVVAGMVLPLLLAALYVQIGRQLQFQVALPLSRIPSPPTPPPRLIPAIG